MFVWSKEGSNLPEMGLCLYYHVTEREGCMQPDVCIVFLALSIPTREFEFEALSFPAREFEFGPNHLMSETE